MDIAGVIGSTRRAPRGGRRARRALDSARVLDEVVETQLPLVARLPEEGRRRAADYLAELVMLSQAYRHYADGWITRRELERRGAIAMEHLTELRSQRVSPAHLTDRD